MIDDAAPTLGQLGWGNREEANFDRSAFADSEPARVLRHNGTRILVGVDRGERDVPVRPALPPIAVGDWVVLDGERIEDLLPRYSLLQRRDPSTGYGQPIVANVDVVGIVCGLDRGVNTGRIERFVTQVWDAGAVPLVVLTKTDLVGDVTEHLEPAEQAAPGVDIAPVAAELGHGVEDLASLLVDKTVAFVGESGAGKSTLLNVLAGDAIAATTSVRGGDAKGRHTTTARTLHVLAGGYRIIDTPGLREVGLWTEAETVDAVFDDITELAIGCRFNDCRHDTEPGCAVLSAAAGGDLNPDRLESWRRLRREAEVAELRADTHARHQFERHFGRIAREAQRMKRSDRER